MVARLIFNGFSKHGAFRMPKENELRLGRIDELLGYHLRRSSSVFSGAFQRSVAESGLKQVPFAILSAVAANPGIRQGVAGDLLGIQRANMVVLVAGLVDTGLLERTQFEADRRALALRATLRGEKVLEETTARILQEEAAVVAVLSPRERAMLVRLLRKIEACEKAVE